MNSAQRVIKYVAMLFAIFLAINIIFGIVIGVVTLFDILFDTTVVDDMVGTSSNNEFSKVYDEVDSIEIKIEVSKLYIKSGDELKVVANNVDNFKVENENGKLTIKEESKNKLFNIKNDNSVIYVYIPEDVALYNVEIETGIGKSSIEYLNSENLRLEIGVGDLNMNNVIVSDEIKIDGGVGKVYIEDCSFNNLDLNCGIGDFEVSSKITGNSKIDCGIGKFNLKIYGNMKDYTIDANLDIGTLKINGKKVNSKYKYGNGTYDLKIDGGMGNIDLSFLELVL